MIMDSAKLLALEMEGKKVTQFEEEQVGMGELGMMWQKKALIKKACKWLDANFPEIENVGSYYKKSFIELFKKAMEE